MDSTNKYFLPVAVILAGVFIGGAVIWNGMRPATPGSGPDDAGASTVDIADVNIEGAPFIGNPNAPVVIAFWSDFQCPHCKAVETGGIPQIPTPPAISDIIRDYVDTGKARIVFFDFPFLGQGSIDAARYGHAMWKLYPETYFEWREAMYRAQDDEGDEGFGDAASIDKLNATITGIDAARVKADVEANATAYDAIIVAQRNEGQKFGINATPSFIIGTELVQGAAPFANFKAILDPLVR